MTPSPFGFRFPVELPQSSLPQRKINSLAVWHHFYQLPCLHHSDESMNSLFCPFFFFCAVGRCDSGRTEGDPVVFVRAESVFTSNNSVINQNIPLSSIPRRSVNLVCLTCS